MNIATHDIAGNPLRLYSQPGYLNAVCQRANVVRSTVSLIDLPFCVDGAFPSIVAEMFPSALGASSRMPHSASTSSKLPRWRIGELDLLDSEWYFTENSTARLIGLSGAASDVLCLGVPSVAFRLNRHDHKATLVDSSARMFDLSDSRRPIRIVRQNLNRQLFIEPESADVVFVDPPWHVRSVEMWIKSAIQCVRVGGRIIVAVPLNLSHPSAAAVRAAIMFQLRAQASIEICTYENFVTYSTPLFESAILHASDLPVRDWRCADIFEVTIRSKSSANDAIRPVGQTAENDLPWRRLMVGQRTIRISPTMPRLGPLRFQPVDILLDGNVLPIPSLSLINRYSLNVVSSNGRAARVISGGAQLEDAILRVVRGIDVEKSTSTIKGDARTANLLLRQILSEDI